MYNILSVLSGFCIAIMILLNGGMAAHYGNYSSSVIIHILGMATIVVVLITTKSKFTFKNNLPWYYYLGGAVGVVTVLCTNISFMNLGVSLTLALGLLGQTLASFVVDSFGFLGMTKVRFNKKKLLGFVLILAGIIAMAVI